MKELILHATLTVTSRDVTSSWLCTQLSMLIAEPGVVNGELPCHLWARPEEDVLEVWLKDDEPCPDSILCRYRRLAFRPLEVPLSASPGISADVPIAVSLLPPAWLYTAVPLSGLLEQGILPRRVMADGQVLPMERLDPCQMRRMDYLYAVADSELTVRLHCTSHSPQSSGHRPNRYAELEREANLLLSGCFRQGGSAEGCALHLQPTLADVAAHRIHSIGHEYRQLLFGEACTAEDPRSAFSAHGACRPSAKRTLRLVMLYPQGGLETARCLCHLLQSLTRLIAVFPIGHEEGWIEYEMCSQTVENIRQSLLLLKQRNYNQQDLLVCYISPSGDDALTAGSLHLRTHVRLCCRNLELLFMDSVPRRAVEGGGLVKNSTNLASGLVVRLKGLSWVPRQILTQDTDLVICFSQSRRHHDYLCGATFCFNQKASLVHDFTCEERLFLPYLYSDFKVSLGDFQSEHGGRLPRRIVIYCYRNVDVRHLKDFARLLSESLPDIPLVAAFLQLTETGYPAFYDPDSSCRMPPDGTYVSCPDDTYLLFCNDFRPGSIRPPERYPHPLEVRLKHLKPDGSFAPVPPGEAVELMTQVYQLTSLNPERVDRCVLPVLALHTDKLLRCAHDERVAQADAVSVAVAAGRAQSAATSAASPPDGATALGQCDTTTRAEREINNERIKE